jgi:hypothetical protein
MLREIRGVAQRHRSLVRRWFQDDYFDLIVWQDAGGEVERFQLSYARETPAERLLEWRRGHGFQHLKTDAHALEPGRDDAWALRLDGAFPYQALAQRFAAAAGHLPPALSRFVSERMREFAHPPRKFRRKDAPRPRWLERLRARGGGRVS